MRGKIVNIFQNYKWVCFIPVIFFSACSNVKTVATLPDHEVQGYESSGFNLYRSTETTGTTAIGQVFSPPIGHSYLTDVGFALRYNPHNSEKMSDTVVKLRISSWQQDHPAKLTEWEAETKLIAQKTNVEWLRFKVPHLRLIPGQKYIAWLSLAGLNNPEGSSIAVISMGPRTSDQRSLPPKSSIGEFQPDSWKFDYLDGFRAYWRNPNPNSATTGMTKSAWQIDGVGKNLHFEMKFVSSP